MGNRTELTAVQEKLAAGRIQEGEAQRAMLLLVGPAIEAAVAAAVSAKSSVEVAPSDARSGESRIERARALACKTQAQDPASKTSRAANDTPGLPLALPILGKRSSNFHNGEEDGTRKSRNSTGATPMLTSLQLTFDED